MFQLMGEMRADLKNGIKEVVNPALVKSEIKSSWTDFWNLELAVVDREPVTFGIVIVAFLCFVVGIIIAKWVSRRAVRRLFSHFDMAPSALHLWSSVTFYISSLFVTLLALKIAHVPLTIFTLLGGAIALGVGFGSKNIVNNFISGVMFMFEGTVNVGDFVDVNGYFGRIVDVGLRATHLELGLSRRAIVPNSSFLENTIVNWGKAGSPIYLSVSLSVDYASDLKKMEELLLLAPKGVPQVVEGLPTRVLLKSFENGSILLELLFPVHLFSPGDRDTIASNVRKKVDALLNQEGIVMSQTQMFRQVSASVKQNLPS